MKKDLASQSLRTHLRVRRMRLVRGQEVGERV